METDPIRQATMEAIARVNQQLKAMEPEEVAKLIPVALEHLKPAEKNLLKREIRQGADPVKASRLMIHRYLVDQELDRMKKERGLK